MDVNGFIAGMQVAIHEDLAVDDWFNFDSNPYVNKDDILGDAHYLATAYFVEPSIICNGGRSQADFDAQGSGTQLSFQAGPEPTENYLTVAPMEKSEAVKKVCIRIWFIP